MMRCFYLISLVSSLILSIRSSRSLWISSYRSPISFFFICTFFHILSISFFFPSNSSYWLEYLCSKFIFSSSFDLSSCSSLIYTVLFSSSSALLFSKSCSYFMAFSIASEPCRSFSSMFLILLSSFCCLLFSLLAASSLDLSSSKNFYFSSSAISTCC